MNKLSKPKAFEASPKSVLVNFGTQEIECTNLTKSALLIQTVILVGHEGKWHEIEIADLGLDTVHLPSFKHHIESNGLKLSDLGIAPEVKVYGMTHEDFMELEKEYPKYSYFQISKLHEYQKKYGIPSSKGELKKTLFMISQHYLDINAYIDSLETLKDSIISRPEPTHEEDAYSNAVDVSAPQHAIAVEALPVQVPADSVSLQIFEKLTPEKITELQGLRITQEEIVKSNPVVVITNKATYAQAKKTAAILLSASTAIDGNKGVEATATKYLNTFKTMLKTALLPIAKLTREPYDKQKKLIEDWDNRLILQAQNRVKELFAVPFTFNPDKDSYSIGTLIVTQKDIEDLSDADWSKKIEQGNAIKIALDSVKTEQDSRIKALEEQNALLQEQIRAFMALQNPEIEKQNVTADNSASNIIDTVGQVEHASDTYALGSPFAPVSTQSIVDHQNTARGIETEEKEYSLPHPDNKLLNELDLAHVSVLEEKQYIECREYYVQALQDAADAINDILVNPDKTIQKSVAITELIKTWKL